MIVVVDAGIAIKWYLDEVLSDEARLVLSSDDDLLAPDMLFAEVANALWRRFLSHDIGLEQSRLAIDAIRRVFPSPIASSALAGRAFDIATTLRQPVYDCLYLAVAERHRGLVVTADAGLIERLRGTEWRRRALSVQDYAADAGAPHA